MSLCIKSQPLPAKPLWLKELFLCEPKEHRGGPDLQHFLVLNKRHRLNAYYVKSLPAADILASHWVIAPHHVALRLGKTCPIAIIGSTRQLRLFSPHNPFNLILPLLPAVRTGHHMCTLLRPLIKKIAFFHTAPRGLMAELFQAMHPLQSCLTSPLAGKSDA
jgi:hypothetical protein